MADPERIAEIRRLVTQWVSVPNLPDNAIPASPDDVLLDRLVVVTRQRDEAQEKVAWNSEHISEVVTLERGRREAAEDALAAARKERDRAYELVRMLERKLAGRATKAAADD